MTSVNGSTVIKEKGSKNKIENLQAAPSKDKAGRPAKEKEVKIKRKYTRKEKL